MREEEGGAGILFPIFSGAKNLSAVSRRRRRTRRRTTTTTAGGKSGLMKNSEGAPPPPPRSPPLWPAASADSKKGGGGGGEKRTRKKAAAISQKKAQKVAGCNIFCWYVNWQNPISIPFSRQILTYYRHYNYVFFLQKRQFFVCTKKVLHRYLCLCVEVRGADE